MNDYIDGVRRRRQNLMIVEGKHEKNKLFWLIFKCFPEIDIDMDDVWIYGTNIYMLYEDIVNMYGSEWADNDDDIDLPFVISKKQHPDSLYYKKDFINIILVFDYERHDTNFSETKIMKMQQYFVDATDMGKLYINYPMIESYKHLKMLPDCDYADRKIPVSLRPGKKYKAKVKSESAIWKAVEFPHRMDDLLEDYFGVHSEQMRIECCNAILNITDIDEIDDIIQSILQDVVENRRRETLKYQLKDWICKLGYVSGSQTYWQYIRNVFQKIIIHNICKANRIQNDQYQIGEDSYQHCFDRLDLTEILKKQNSCSRNIATGYIWVLNTCIFFIADYRFELVVRNGTDKC